jgi:hypothetical protein
MPGPMILVLHRTKPRRLGIDRVPYDVASSSIASVAPYGLGEPESIIGAEREFSAIAQRDRYGVEAGTL